MTQRDQLPTGTITFLFTDIERSTQLLQQLGEEQFRVALETHNDLLRRAVGDDGVVVRTIGDAFFAVFPDPLAAVSATANAQRLLHAASWPDDVAIEVRMGLHTGSGTLGGDDYVGLDVHRAARIADTANGGQVLLSESTAALVSHQLPVGLTVRSLGDYRLKDLSEFEPLHQLDIEGLQAEFPPLRTIDAVAGNLPVQLTSFVGRSTELVELTDLLARSRLITLTGPGGTGKTRLSIQVAAESAHEFADGAFFVSLEAITDPELIPPAVLESLGLTNITSGVEPGELVTDYLANRHLLLVLDNLEQIHGASGYVSGLLAGAPDTKVIATSRAPLHISGEQEYPVPPLSIPDAEALTHTEALSHYEGVELFTERALAVRPDFTLNDDNLAAIAELTTRLDGLPLAIELAASRVKVLPPDAILSRLSNRLLASPARDLPERQQTIANAIGWSYDLLDEPVRRLFEDCSVFMGGATLEFIQRITQASEDAVLDRVTTLVDHSLQRLIHTEGEPRYQMLVVVREFAYAALVARGDDDTLRERHALAYADLAGQAAPTMLTSRRAGWLDRLTAEHDNLRAALDWAIELDRPDVALDLVANLWRFWQARGHLQEARERIDLALALDGGKPRARAFALEAKGGVAYWQGRLSDTQEPNEQALDLLRRHGDQSDIANALYNASFSRNWAGDRETARAYLDESLSLAEASGDRLAIGRAYWGLCDRASYNEDWEKTIRHAQRAEAIFNELDAPYDLGWSRFMLAFVHFQLGDLERAREYHVKGLRNFADIGDLSALMLFLLLKAGILLGEGNTEVGAQIFGAAEQLQVRIGVSIADVDVNEFEYARALRDDPSPEIQAAIIVGKQMSLDDAVDLARSS